MKVKVIQFTDYRICVFNEPCYVPDVICHHVQYWDALPKDSLLEFSCIASIFVSALYDENELKKVIDIFLKN